MIQPHYGPLLGFVRERVETRFYVDLMTTFGHGKLSQRFTVRYLIVEADTSYFALIGRKTLNELGAIYVSLCAINYALSRIDNQGHLLLYFSKTIRVFGLAETIKTSMSFVKTIIVFFTFPRLSESFVSKTITVFFTFPRLSRFIVLWRLSMSFALYIFKDHQSLLFQGLSESSVETSMYPLLFKTPRSFV
ncbi:hypothetical protein JHK86_043112 [Glycine max]|nr:hypothetical protein JHK86_043112 [Glycine max]